MTLDDLDPDDLRTIEPELQQAVRTRELPLLDSSGCTAQ